MTSSPPGRNRGRLPQAAAGLPGRARNQTQPDLHRGLRLTRKAATKTRFAAFVFFAALASASYADYSAKQSYDMIGNPRVDAPEQHHAFYLLQTQSGFEPFSSSADFTTYTEANYYLAECYVSGKTGEGGPDYLRNKNPKNHLRGVPR
jgi:hypothetical protein